MNEKELSLSPNVERRAALSPEFLYTRGGHCHSGFVCIHKI
jgi:hypothetical protein